MSLEQFYHVGLENMPITLLLQLPEEEFHGRQERYERRRRDAPA